MDEKLSKSCFCFFTDGKQHEADMITLRNHALPSYMTWLLVTLSVLDMIFEESAARWRHRRWFWKFTVHFRPIRKDIVSSMYNGWEWRHIYTLFDGLTYNARGYFASCVVFFRAPKKNTSNEQNVHSYYTLNHRIRDLLFHHSSIFKEVKVRGRKQGKVRFVLCGHFVAPL